MAVQLNPVRLLEERSASDVEKMKVLGGRIVEAILEDVARNGGAVSGVVGESVFEAWRLGFETGREVRKAEERLGL